MHVDKREILAFAVLFLLTLSVLSYVPRPFLEAGTYEVALDVKEGMAADSYLSFFSFLTGAIYSLIFGDFNPAALTGMLSAMPVIIGLISVILLYPILRYMRFSIAVSFVLSILFLTSPIFLLSSIPGVYSPGTLSLMSLIAGILFLLLTEKHIAFSIPSLAFFLLSSAIHLPSSIPAFAIIISFILSRLFTKKDIIPMLITGIPLLLFIIFFTDPLSILQPSADISSFLQNNRFLFPLASVSLIGAVRKFREENDLLYFSLFIFAVISGILFPIGAVLLLSILAANGLRALFSASATRNEKIAIYYALFLFFCLSFSLGEDIIRSVILSLFLSSIGVFILYMYKFKPRLIPLSITAFLLISSITSALFLTQSSSLFTAVKGYSYSTIDKPAFEAFEWMNENTQSNAMVAFIGDKRPFLFVSERMAEENDALIASFLVSNESTAVLREKGITHILVSADIFGESSVLRTLTSSDFNAELYSYYGNSSFGETQYAIFASPQKEILIRIVDEQGRFLLEDAVLRDEDGSLISYVPFSQLLLLHEDAPYYSPGNPVIRPLNTYDTNAFLLFFGHVEGMKEVYSKGQIKIFEVG